MANGSATPAQAQPGAIAAAREAGLRYCSDRGPGIARRKTGKGFHYLDASGRPLRKKETLGRIRQLAIPPAWTDVWICPSATGHIQATGRDDRGRKQYKYHAGWSASRGATKFDRTIAFGKALPRIRRQVARDLRSPGLGKGKVLAVIVRLLETTLIRVGNEEYVRQNRSFGLTTLRDRHVSFRRGTVHFHFSGKSGKVHDVDLRDPRLARLVKRLQDLPGQDLFQYVDEEGRPQKVASEEINAYVRAAAGEEFSAKDFRTWWGTMLAALALGETCREKGARPTKKRMLEVIGGVAQSLGNTPTICRKSYIHPAVMEAYLAGQVVGLPERIGNGKTLKPLFGAGASLAREEIAVIDFLKRQGRKRPPTLEQALKRSIGRR
ncbi:MAG: putative topoisomerase [Verrucomicrobia bacterium]|nr:putative topoisomerase [Verrucomicrobiota bacterium]